MKSLSKVFLVLLLLLLTSCTSNQNLSLDKKVQEPLFLTAKEASIIALKEVEKWQEAKIAMVESTFEVNLQGKSSSWLFVLITPDRASRQKVYLKNGKVINSIPLLGPETPYQPLPDNWIDSSEALDQALKEGFVKTQSYSMALGKPENLKDDQNPVWKIQIIVSQNNKNIVKTTVVDAINKEGLQ